MTSTQVTTVADIHVHGDQLWIREFNETAKMVSSVDEFMDSLQGRGLHTVRLIGCERHAKLITRLYEAKNRQYIGSVQLASPLTVRTRRERSSPHSVLYAMPRMVLASSLGGFHEMTSADYQVYNLAATLKERGWCQKAQILYRAHPLSRALDFIPTIDQQAAAWVMSQVCDPRWFVDTRRPNSPNKLQMFLGLNPKTQQSVTHGGEPWGSHIRCTLVRQCWKEDTDLFTAAEKGARYPVRGSTLAGERPGDFLLRYWLRQRAKSEVHADLRTSQLFLDFFRMTWLQTTYADRLKEAAGDTLFRPQDFFKYVVEVEAYNHHMLRKN